MHSQEDKPDVGRPIYRIMRLCYLLRLFEEELNVLVKPHKWKDPFENFIIESENVYGQCWTFEKASNALWKIYSQNSDAIRVKSRVGTLKKSLQTAIGDSAHSCVFMEQVRYLPEARIKQFAGKLCKEPKPFSNHMVAKALLIKKKAFEYEHEVRLLFFQEKLHAAIKNLFCYPVDPHKLIEQIMIDPQITRQCYRHLKKYIHETTGFPEDKIKQSRIYDPPPGTQQYSQKGEPIKI